jgi:hypothetical protein
MGRLTADAGTPRGVPVEAIVKSALVVRLAQAVEYADYTLVRALRSLHEDLLDEPTADDLEEVESKWAIEGVSDHVASSLKTLLNSHRACNQGFWDSVERVELRPFQLEKLRKAIVQGAILLSEAGQLQDDELWPLIEAPKLRELLHEHISTTDSRRTHNREPNLEPLTRQFLSSLLSCAASLFRVEDLAREWPWSGTKERETLLFRLATHWHRMLDDGLSIGEPYDWFCLLGNLHTNHRWRSQDPGQTVERTIERLDQLQRMDDGITGEQATALIRLMSLAWDARQLVAFDRAMTRYLRCGEDDLLASLLEAASEFQKP